MSKDVNTCISCGINDELVEAGGIYYCPNPFCTVSGSTNWKRENLNVRETGNRLILLNNDGWLEKGMAVIDKMPYELGVKIMASKKTQEIISDLKKESP